MEKDINKLTVGEAMARIEESEKLRGIFNMGSAPSRSPSDDGHWEIGKNYFIRTVTHHMVGRLAKVTKEELVLMDAAWVADDGRFSKCLEEGTVEEAEACPDGPAIIGRGALIDAYIWKHDLIRENRPS